MFVISSLSNVFLLPNLYRVTVLAMPDILMHITFPFIRLSLSLSLSLSLDRLNCAVI